MAVGSAVSALNRPGWIRKAQQVFTARFALAARRPLCFCHLRGWLLGLRYDTEGAAASPRTGVWRRSQRQPPPAAVQLRL